MRKHRFSIRRMAALWAVAGWLLLAAAPLPASAQCAMCKANVEKAQGQEKALGTGLNTGILYLLAAPYLAAIIIGGLWYRHHRLQKRQELSL
jgi:hypothetical protein